MNRILIVGSNGAGKSTFSYRLAERTGLPLVHMDQIYWSGDWQVRPQEEYEAMVLREAQKPRWIIEGNNINSLERRLEYADTVFWFEFPPVLCVINILKREITHRGKVRPDLPDQCISKLDRKLLRFLRYAWNFNRKRHPHISSLLERYPDITVIRFTSRRQADSYLKSM